MANLTFQPGSTVPVPRLLTTAEMADLLGTTTAAIHMRVVRGTVPAPIKLGGRSYWRAADIENWINERAAAAREGVVYAGN